VSLSFKSYQPILKEDWDYVLNNSINGTFLHRREFIEYHENQFEDASLLIYYKSNPVAIFPANRVDNKVFSHQGISYGGLIIKNGLNFSKQSQIVKGLLEFFKLRQVSSLEIKSIPVIYSQESQESIDFLLMSNGAKISFFDITYAIAMPCNQIGRNGRWKIRKSHLRKIDINQSSDYAIFWEELLVPNLKEKFGVNPVHSISEIKTLQSLFPNSIKLYFASEKGQLLGGVCIFETDRVAHVQYVAASSDGKKNRALDYLINHLIQHEFNHKAFFDFGRNVDSLSNEVNMGLVEWKESFGAKPFLQKSYLIELV
jgi:hypothetical protein